MSAQATSSGSGKADADAKHGHDSVEHADADPKAKDHSANGKADDAADSTSHGDKTDADKPTSDKSHKEDDTAHHDGDLHPKDTDDKHSAKNDDADTKSPKDDADNSDGADQSDAPHSGSTDSQSDLFPHDYPANTFKDEADPEIGSHASDFVKNNPESKEPPTTVDDLAERSPKRPYIKEKDGQPHSDDGLGDRYKTGKDITLDAQGQLKNGAHPEMDSTADWATSRYALENGRPRWREGLDHGEVPGTDRYYTNLNDLTEDFHIVGLDRTGASDGGFLAPIVNGHVFGPEVDDCIIPSEFRSTPPGNINERYHQYKFTNTELPDGWRAEISIAASDHGSLGGSPQIRIVKRDGTGDWTEVPIEELLSNDPPILKGVSNHVGTVQRPDFQALHELFNNARGTKE